MNTYQTEQLDYDDDSIDVNSTETEQTESKPAKRGRGRPTGTTKDMLEERRQMAFAQENVTKNAKRMMNKETTALCRKMLRWKPIDIRNYKEVSARTDQFLDLMESNGVPLTIEAYSYALGVARTTLSDYISGRIKLPEDVHALLSRMREMAQANLAIRLDAEDKNPASKIFLAKNNYGYSDRQEFVVTPNNPFGDIQSPDQIAAKYADLVEIEE